MLVPARRSRGGAWLAGVIALAGAAGALAVPPAVVASSTDAGAAQTRYSIAGGCYALQGPSGFVARAGDGYAVFASGRGGAEPFRMQATDLGTYLLYDSERRFLADDEGAIEAAAGPSRAAEWRAERPSTGRFAFINRGSGRSPAIDRGKLVTGPLTKFRLRPTRGCADFPEISLNARGKPFEGRTPYGEVRGFWDPHMHIMAFEAFGGGVHCGRPWHRYGVTHALPDCAETDGPAGATDPPKNFLNWGGPVFPHDTVGWPTFKDWPNHHSLTYEQTYYRWLQRSWKGGLRLAVNLFVDNRAFCIHLAQPQHRRNPCNEMETVRREARAIYEMQDYIDAQAGGPGKGFLRIVRNPFQARRVINRGKLAVVLGIEISELFGCIAYNGVPQCDKADVDRALKEVHDLGVRDLELLNKFDNAFVGVRFDSGTLSPFVNYGNFFTTGRWWQARRCPGAEQDNSISPAPAAGDPIYDSGLLDALPPGGLPIYPSAPHCNVLGMTPLGEYLVRKMIRRGMIIDPDHMSVLAANRALEISAQKNYSGLVSSHSWTDKRNWPDIYALGGVVAPKAGSSKSFIRTWREARKMRDPDYYFGFGFGDDMNGFASQGAPREGAPNPVRYPFRSFDGGVALSRQRSGERVFDINEDGVAHFGLYPDWVEDLRRQAGGRIVRDLARGAEAYLQMWERAVGVPRERCLPRGARLTAHGLGKLRIGDSATEVLRRAGQPDRRIGRVYRYCVAGSSKATVRAVFDGRGRLKTIERRAADHARR